MLSGISVMCFAASYAVALALEVSRLFVRVVARTPLRIGFAAAGLFAQSVYMVYQFRQNAAAGVPSLSWYTGCLTLAWVFVAAYLVTFLASRRSTSGLILLPTSLLLIGMAHAFPNTQERFTAWTVLHGVSLGVGMTLVAFGFTTALLYLFQSWRLKHHKLLSVPRLWLPSLEQLQRMNERCLLASLGFLGFGLVSGIALNMVRARSAHKIPWTDPVVLASMVWLLWLLAVAVFSSVYRPARQGRKVAYMTLGSFLFLALILGIMWTMPSQHGATIEELQMQRAMEVDASEGVSVDETATNAAESPRESKSAESEASARTDATLGVGGSSR